MGVHLRKKQIANGKESLYLDFYPPVKGEKGTYTRREYLKRYIYEKPKTAQQKLHNKENLVFAEGLKNRREKEILNEQDGLFNTKNKKRDFIEFFQSLCDNRKETDGTYGNWLSALKYLKAYTGENCKMGDLTEGFCSAYKKYLLHANRLNTVKGLKLSQNSAVSYFNKFRCAINEAFDARLINENPLRHIKGIKEKETKREFLTQEELQLLAKTECDLDALKNVAIFSALTGLRWSDIKNLTWGDIQKTKSSYFLHIFQKKTDDVIMHPISETAVKVLGEKGKPIEKVFEGLKYSDSNNDKIKRWVLRAGINKKITLHNFRHTYATLLLNKGVDIFTVSKMLGHKNIQTTMIYAKVLTETKVNAANQIDLEL
ncbi:MAG: site-specific integrase [Bacteroidetes bacterium]|nr:site-specific integrase [Bacteroidota bacterium]MDA0980265.1 site-specific integrase [Bacteroidota bacterium]